MKNQNLKDYSKARLLISIFFGILLLYAFFQLLSNYITFNTDRTIEFSICNPCKSDIQIYKEYLQILLLFIGMILFALNRKLTDYISFIVFIILVVLSTVEYVNSECFTESDYFNKCLTGYISVLLFLSLPLVFLFINFIKSSNK